MKPLYVLLLMAVPWCNDPLSESTPISSGPVQVQVGYMAFVEGGTLRFDSLLAESRCPIGMMCIWAGEAVIRVQWTRMTRTSSFTLKLPGGANAQNAGAHIPFDTLGYRFTLQQLDPYPDPHIRIAYGSYTATIRVENISGTVRR
jgi:hypothetical protein